MIATDAMKVTKKKHQFGDKIVNNTVGDKLSKIHINKTLRIHHQNINGAKLYSSWSSWKEELNGCTRIKCE
jgi:hypothetical protein